MQVLPLVRNFGRNDVKLISRDHFLLSMLFFVLIIATTLRFGLPWLNAHLEKSGVLPTDTIPHSLADFYPMLLAFFVIFQGPLMAGAIFGFSLLDEKDDNTIKAMLVTPIPFSTYVIYRVSVPTVLAFVIVVVEMLFINQATLPFWKLLLISAGASLVGPIAALFYAVTAENKVQGFAIAKFVGLAGCIILLGWFVDEPWQWLCGIFPPFLISKAYWMALSGNNLWPTALGLGVILQLALLALLVNRFNKVAYH